jgi:hypothetical protein
MTAITRAKGRRKATFEKRRLQWLHWMTRGFVGFGVCVICKTQAYCAGPDPNTRRCKECCMEGRRVPKNTNGKVA